MSAHVMHRVESRSTGGGVAARVRRVVVTLAGLLLVIGASTVGLHDLAEAHLGAPAHVEGPVARR